MGNADKVVKSRAKEIVETINRHKRDVVLTMLVSLFVRERIVSMNTLASNGRIGLRRKQDLLCEFLQTANSIPVSGIDSNQTR